MHLEAFRPSLRARQVDELIASIEGRQRPLIVMGDFNTGWNGRRESLKKLAEALDLKAHDPESPDHVSLPVFNRRLDWILISREFEFRSYRTLGDPVSDHRAVVAEIELRRPEAQHSEERIGDARSNDRGQT